MKGKRLLALALSAAMVTGSNMTVFAADQEGGEQGTGELQYVATSDVFNVVLPTEKTTGTASTFDYILDPDGLIAATKDQTDKRYSGTFETGKTVYFKHATAVGGSDYTDTSDELVVTNKSTQDVELTVTAKVAEADGVKMDVDGTFAEGAGNLYMVLKGKVTGEASDTESVIDADGVEVKVTIPKDDDAYEVKWNATKKQYEKALTEAASKEDNSYTGFKTYTFKLTGACKAKDAGLLALKENPPKVDLTWSVKDFTVTGPQVTFKDGVITISELTAEKNYKASVLEYNGTSYPLDKDTNVTWGMTDWNKETGGTLVITLKEKWLTFIGENSAKVTVTLADGTTIDANKQ